MSYAHRLGFFYEIIISTNKFLKLVHLGEEKVARGG